MSQKERKFIVIALLIIFAATILNLRVARRKSRDAQRKADIRQIHNALERYKSDFGFFPVSLDGKMVACEPVEIDEQSILFSPCKWGHDSLVDVGDPNYPAYLERIPSDPEHDKGARYYYLSSQKYFQLFASLEGKNEAEYDSKIKARNLPCGTRVCNFGLAFKNIPLDKSIEEYENEIDSK